MSGTFPHCKRPCAECPWKLENKPGKFSRDRYRALVDTAVDMAARVFACHMSTESTTTACAGFLLSLDARHNFSVRMACSGGALDLHEVSSTVPLHASYYRLARANGVPASDLQRLRRDCR
jgi:hypothetical protein